MQRKIDGVPYESQVWIRPPYKKDSAFGLLSDMKACVLREAIFLISDVLYKTMLKVPCPFYCQQHFISL